MIGAQILLRTARPVAQSKEVVGRDTPPHPSRLRREIPGFDQRIKGKRVLDFGCGTGGDAVAMALLGASGVVGVDIQPGLLAQGRARAARWGVADRVRFAERLDADERFDVVVSCDSFEHFRDPEAVLGTMLDHLAHDGALIVSFGPPWYSAYGAHMMHWCPIPWVQLLFPERAVMEARKHFAKDGAERYADCTGGLNRMSRARFHRIVRSAGLRAEYVGYDYMRGMRRLGRLPILSELLTTNVAAVLRKPVRYRIVDPPMAPARIPEPAGVWQVEHRQRQTQGAV